MLCQEGQSQYFCLLSLDYNDPFVGGEMTPDFDLLTSGENCGNNGNDRFSSSSFRRETQHDSTPYTDRCNRGM